MSNLNLRRSVVDDFWRQKNPKMGGILKWMENMERWSLDKNEDFLNALMSIIPLIERSEHRKLSEHSDEILKILAYLSSSRTMRIMEWLDKHFPDGLTTDLVYAARQNSDDVHAQLMIDRLRALNSLHLLSQVFTEKRMLYINLLLKENERF